MTKLQLRTYKIKVLIYEEIDIIDEEERKLYYRHGHSWVKDPKGCLEKIRTKRKSGLRENY